MKLLLLVTLLTFNAAAFTTNLSISQCTDNGCTKAPKRIALDQYSKHTNTKGEELIHVDDDALTLTYGGPHESGPRVYLIEEEGSNKNHVFMLKNQEFTFDVELSSLPCGFNASIYFSGMKSNDGGAENGTNYCDAQAVGGTFCSEMDIMEANTEAAQVTTHACIDTCGSFTSDEEQCKTGHTNICDQGGCGLNPFRHGPGSTYNTETSNDKFYGKGSEFQLDSTQKFTVVTQFHTEDNTESGALSSIERFYIQNDKVIELPTLYIKSPTDGTHLGGLVNPSLSKEFCTDTYDRWNGDKDYEPFAQIGNNMDSGMVLAMSIWYQQETYVDGKPDGGNQTGMSWLDGSNYWGKTTKCGSCSQTTTDTGEYHVTYSDIRTGDIGTTVSNYPDPNPTPPPTPTEKCCYNDCTHCQSGWCGLSQANCEGNCNMKWCIREEKFESSSI